MSQAAMNADAFSEMKEMMGESFNDIIALCLQLLPEQLAEIESAIKSDNAEIVFHASHKMKSSCGSIGAFGLAEKAEAIEIISRDGSTEISEQAISELRDSANQVISILNNEIK